MDVSIQERLVKMKLICEEKISKREALLVKVSMNEEKIRSKEKRNNEIVIESSTVNLTLAERRSASGKA